MRQTRAVRVGKVQVGGGAPVSVQSMTKTDTADVEGTVRQIEEMVRAGCEIVRVAVPDKDAAVALKEIRRRTPADVPLVADIHFHYKLALMALEAGVDKLRLNPGNIGSIERVREVVRAAAAQRVPIRIGVNGGSLEKDLLKKYGTATRTISHPARTISSICLTVPSTSAVSVFVIDCTETGAPPPICTPFTLTALVCFMPTFTTVSISKLPGL